MIVTEEKSELEDEGKLTVNIQVTSPEGPSFLDTEFTNPAGVTFSVTADSQDSSGTLTFSNLSERILTRNLAGAMIPYSSLLNPYDQQYSEHRTRSGWDWSSPASRLVWTPSASSPASWGLSWTNSPGISSPSSPLKESRCSDPLCAAVSSSSTFSGEVPSFSSKTS